MGNELQLQTQVYRTTLIGTEVLKPSSPEEWRNYGVMLGMVDEARQWAVGDWLVDGKSHYGDGLYKEASQILGFEEPVLRRFKMMAERFELLSRDNKVSYKHYETVASIKKTKEKDGKLSVSSEYDIEKQQEILAEAAKTIKRADNKQRQLTVKELRELVQRHKQQQEASIVLANSPEMYDVIYADPPWRYDFPVSGSRKIEHHQYPTMEYENICDLNVPSSDDAVCLLWAPNSFLHKGLGVLKAWGFDYRTTMVWVKPSIGMGQWVRARHELLLIGTKGDIKTPADADKPDSVLEFDRREHSQKPDEVYDIINSMFPELRKLELFARNEQEGWAAWGDQVPTSVKI